jgi:hypothetical protein
MTAVAGTTHLRQAWRRVDDDGQLAALAGSQQRLLQRCALGRRGVLEAAAVEHHAAALLGHPLGQHHLCGEEAAVARGAAPARAMP